MASPSALTPLQRDFLDAFFSHTQEYFLTGGGALIGFYGLKRHTDDLDLFTLDDTAFQASNGIVSAACQDTDARFESVASYPTFHRYQVERGEETLQVDIVRELAPQIADKARFGAVIVDEPAEILANKLGTIVGRCEVREFWDAYHLVQQGHSLDEALLAANRKDGGVDASSLVYVLSQINWDAVSRLTKASGLTDWDRVRAYFESLCEQLAVRIAPRGEA